MNTMKICIFLIESLRTPLVIICLSCSNVIYEMTKCFFFWIDTYNSNHQPHPLLLLWEIAFPNYFLSWIRWVIYLPGLTSMAFIWNRCWHLVMYAWQVWYCSAEVGLQKPLQNNQMCKDPRHQNQNNLTNGERH